MKILHLPNEIAGQIGITVKGQQELGYEACSLTEQHPFHYSFPTDFVLPNRSNKMLKALDRIKLFVQIAEQFDVFHYYFASSLLPWRMDVLYEKFREKKVIVEFLGSDVRLPDTELKRNPYYINSYHESEKVNIERMKRWSDLTEGEVVFPDHTFNAFLSPYFDTIHVVGQRVDCFRYAPVYPSLEKRKIRVVHAPSQLEFKGSKYVEKAVERLHKKGVEFEYIRVHGKTHDEAMEIYQTADLIVDQLCAGSHGIFACEAMALGKPVICYILPELEPGYPKGFPIINANPDTIESVLEEWIQVPEKLHERGKKSRTYAEKVHDYRACSRDILKLYQGDNTCFKEGEMFDWRKNRRFN